MNTSQVDARLADTAQLPLPLDVNPPAAPARRNVRIRRPYCERCTSMGNTGNWPRECLYTMYASVPVRIGQCGYDSSRLNMMTISSSRHTQKKNTLQGCPFLNPPGTGEKAVSDVENAQAPHASVSVANPTLSILLPARESITIAIMKCTSASCSIFAISPYIVPPRDAL